MNEDILQLIESWKLDDEYANTEPQRSDVDYSTKEYIDAEARLGQRAREIKKVEELVGKIKAEKDSRKQQKSKRQRFVDAFQESYGEGREDHTKAFWTGRTLLGQDIESPRLSQMFGSNPTYTRTRDLLNVSDPAHRLAREQAGLGLQDTNYERTAQMLGTVASDLTQDRLRGAWWLFNAPQAVVNVGQEALLGHFAPELYEADRVVNPKTGKEITLEKENYEDLMRKDLIGLTSDGEPVLKAGVNKIPSIDPKKRSEYIEALSKRRYRPGSVQSLLIPSGIAVNAGVGLLNPLGGSNGYSAVFESEDDPQRTSNVVGEVAAKYILGRTGKLLNWDDFKEVRPDVSKGEYNAYKAFKYDKSGDFDLSDGDFTVPTGVLKGTMEGIHGPELQFLGRSLPLTTALMPIAAAVGGTVAGAAYTPEEFRQYRRDLRDLRKVSNNRMKDIDQKYSDITDRDINREAAKAGVKKVRDDINATLTNDQRNRFRKVNRIRNGIAAGLGSYATALVGGLALENERRRRNQAENERNNQF